MSRRTAAPRGGFTLIELLVVIAIIAVLVALIVPAAMRVKSGADNTAERQTIGQIATAIGSYKAKMQVRHIPATFVADDDYTDAGSDVPSAVYLKSVFPQINLANTGLATAYGGAKARPVPLDGNQTLTLFLTGGLATNYQGFSTNRVAPFTAATTGDQRLGPFYEVNTRTTNASGRLLDRWGTPYAYFAHNATQGTNTYGWQSFTEPANGTTVTVFVSAVGPPVKYLEPSGFQLISAGSDGKFGPGCVTNLVPLTVIPFVPGEGNYAPEVDGGGDDLANFHGGILSNR